MATGSGAVHAYGWGLRYVAWRERRELVRAYFDLARPLLEVPAGKRGKVRSAAGD
jgi:hypothetical protein